MPGNGTLRNSRPTRRPSNQERKTPKDEVITQAMRDWLTDRETLRRTAGMSLAQRILDFGREFPNVVLRRADLRNIYKGAGITYQLMTTRLGGANLRSTEYQE